MGYVIKKNKTPLYSLSIILNLFMSDHTNKIDGLEKSMRQVEQNHQKSERKMDQFIEKTDQFIEKTDQLFKRNEEKMDMIISQLKEINKNSHASNQRFLSLQNEIRNPRNASFNTQIKTKESYMASIENWDRRFQASREELKKSKDKYDQKFEKTNAHISAMIEENKKKLQAIRDSQKSNTKLQQKQQITKFSNLRLIENYVGKSFTSLSKSASSLFSSLTQCLGLLNKSKEKLQMAQEQAGELLSPSQQLHTEPTTSFIGQPSTNKKRQQ